MSKFKLHANKRTRERFGDPGTFTGIPSNAIGTGGGISIDTPTLVEHRFTSNGSFVFLTPGSISMDYLVLGGGGA